MSKINIIDSVMGSGKTSWAIDKMENDCENDYIYITPYLKEIDRIKESCKNKKFFDPKHRGKGKLDSLHRLLLKNRNIASTHALFKMSNNITKGLIASNDYILILDEVMEVVEQVPLKKNDLDILVTNNLITTKEDGLVVWNKDKIDFESKYDDIKTMCLNNNLYLINNILFLWTFPVDIFKCFKEVYICTYLFDGQIQKYYYDFYNIDYKYYSIEKRNDIYQLVDYKKYSGKQFKNLISILDNSKMNLIGLDKYALSKTWYGKEDNKPLVKQLQKNLSNYYKNILKSKSCNNLWTTFKDNKNQLSGKGYTKGFISCNIRATNDYANTYNLAYCCNIFFNPIIKNFFINRNIEINQDMFALSELLQWIWRSRIRKNEKINLYIPSERMRNLLKKYLEK